MIKKQHTCGGESFYGTTTVGEKGQVVIPAEARDILKITKGEKLLVFGMGDDMVVFSKLSHMEKFATHLSNKLDVIRSIIKQTERPPRRR